MSDQAGTTGDSDRVSDNQTNPNEDEWSRRTCPTSPETATAPAPAVSPLTARKGCSPGATNLMRSARSTPRSTFPMEASPIEDMSNDPNTGHDHRFVIDVSRTVFAERPDVSSAFRCPRCSP